jgi:hypothetical protein|tara:strand:+ start:8824 stop:9282 length:459 start_codon:yes stop_codon:yes gene_type:complete
MALIKWKQISGQLGNYGNLTGSLDVSGSINLNGQVIGTGKLDETTFNTYTSSVASNLVLDTGSAHFISGSIDLAVFKQTGSYYSTSNIIHITGALSLNVSNSGDVFSIFSGSTKTVSINEQGVLQLVSQSSTPTPVAGGLYLDTNYDLYIGQ